MNGIKYAIKHGFPSLQRLAKYEEGTEITYHRLLETKEIHSFASSYQTTRFYLNFMLRHANHPLVAGENHEIYCPDSADEEELEKARRKPAKLYNIFDSPRRTPPLDEDLPYHERKLARGPYGYYDHIKLIILDCLTNPRISCVFPYVFNAAYKRAAINKLGSFKEWAAEIIVPMVVKAWTCADLPTKTEAEIDRILFARRTKDYTDLLIDTDEVQKRLRRYGCNEIVCRPSDRKWLLEMDEVAHGTSGKPILDGNPNARLLY